MECLGNGQHGSVIHLPLKLATWDQYGDVLDMAHKFAKHSPYAHKALDDAKISELVMGFLDGDRDKVILILATDDDGKPIGLLAGMTSEILFSHEKIAHEVMWWMEPEHRGSRESFRLVEAFEFWARKIKADIIQLSTVETEYAERVGKFYKRKGYQLVERTYVKEI